MIGTNDLLYPLPDIIPVLICRFHQLLQLIKELFNVKRNRATDMNQIVFRLLQTFLCHQLFFIKLLTRSES